VHRYSGIFVALHTEVVILNEISMSLQKAKKIPSFTSRIT